MKFLKKLFVALISIIVVVAILTGVGYYYVKSTYGIDLIKTIIEVKTLTEEVDEEKLITNRFSISEMVDVEQIANQSVENLISYTKEHGYKVNFDDLPSEMKYLIKLSDKQVAALADVIIKQETNGKIDIAGTQVGIELKQVDFTSIENENATINTVFTINIQEFINKIPNSFPFTSVKKYIPEILYISSTVDVIKGDVEFAYTVNHNKLTINNLNSSETEDLFHTLDVIMKFGSAKLLNEELCNVMMNALIGNEENNGLAYSLKKIGAKDYTFFVDGAEYFAVSI